MRQIIKYILAPIFLLIIPTAGYLASDHLEVHHDSVFYQTIQPQFNRPIADIKAMGVTPQVACGNPANKEFCDFYKKFDLLKNTGQLIVFLGIALLLLPPVLFWLMAREPGLLALSFVPLLRVFVVFLAVSFMIQTAIIVFCYYLLGVLVFHWFNVGVAEAVIISGILMSVGTMFFAVFTVRVPGLLVTGGVVDPDSKKSELLISKFLPAFDHVKNVMAETSLYSKNGSGGITKILLWPGRIVVGCWIAVLTKRVAEIRALIEKEAQESATSSISSEMGVAHMVFSPEEVVMFEGPLRDSGASQAVCVKDPVGLAGFEI